MSCIRKEANGIYYRYWYCLPGACEKHPQGGKQHGQSLHVSDGKTAASLQKDLDKILEEKRRYVVRGEVPPKAVVDLTLAEWQETYLAYKQGKMKPQSLETARYALQHFARYLGVERKLRLVDRDDMQKYWRYCMDLCKYSPHTLSSRRATLASAFADAVKMECMGVNPMQYVERVKLSRTKKAALDRDILHAAFAHEAKPFSVLLRATYLTGGRISELLSLKRRWVNRRDGYFTFVEPKEGDDKVLHLYEDLRQCFDEAERYSGPGEYVFTWQGQPINRNVAYKHFRKIGKAIGVHLNPHALRHSRITHLLDDGIPTKDVMGLVGHRNLSTTEKYAHTNAKRQKEIEGRLSLRSALSAV